MKMNFLKIPVINKFLLIFITILTPAFSIDNPHYYKSPYLNATKSWKKKDWLSIFDAHYSRGSSHRSRNNRTSRVNTFELYGNHNLLYATSNVPQPTNILTTLQGYIDALDAQRASFGFVDFFHIL